MKRKLWIFGMAIMLTCMLVIAGCDTLLGVVEPPVTGGPEAELTAVGEVMEKYARLGDAQEIEQEIGIKSGSVEQYASTRTYRKTADGYKVTVRTKQLNALGGNAGAYTETEEEDTVPSGPLNSGLKLDELYFEGPPKYENGVLEVAVRDGSAGLVFGIPLSGTPTGLKLRIETDAEHVTGMTITYGYQGKVMSEVTITLRFTYTG